MRVSYAVFGPDGVDTDVQPMGIIDVVMPDERLSVGSNRHRIWQSEVYRESISGRCCFG